MLYVERTCLTTSPVERKAELKAWGEDDIRGATVGLPVFLFPKLGITLDVLFLLS